MSYFAEQLKKFRSKAGLSMQELADAASVSKSMICKIEREEVQPTIDVAGRLAKALGKTLSEMLHATQNAQALYIPRNEQAVWEDTQGIKRRNISPIFEGLKIEWLQVELPPDKQIAKPATMVGQKGGEKFILVNKGTLDLKINQKTYKLKKGDSIYFDANPYHEFSNSGKEPNEFMIVIKHED